MTQVFWCLTAATTSEREFLHPMQLPLVNVR